MTCTNGYSKTGYTNTTTSGFTTTGSANTLTASYTCLPRTYKVTLDPKLYASASDTGGTAATSNGTTAYWYVHNDHNPSYFYKVEITSASDKTTSNQLGSNGYTITKPTLTGYTFGGYFVGKTGTGNQYMTADGTGTNNLWSNTGTDGRKDITLYAKWTANTYTVTYNAGTGGSGSITSGSATYNNNFTPATPSSSTIKKDNATFAGWAVSGTSDTKSAGTAFKWTYTENKTFTATWNCNAGYYLDTNSSSSTYNKCVPCAAGTFKGSVGNGACSICNGNTYAQTTGKTSCEACPAEAGIAIITNMIEQNGITDANGIGTGTMANRVRIKLTEMIPLNPGTYNLTFGNQGSIRARGFYTYSVLGDESSAVVTNGSVIINGTTLTLSEKRYVRIVFQKSDASQSITPSEVIAAQPVLKKSSAYTISGTAVSNHDNVNDCKITCPAGTYVAASGGSCEPCVDGSFCLGGTVGYGSTISKTACPAVYPHSASSSDAKTDCYATNTWNVNGGSAVTTPTKVYYTDATASGYKLSTLPSTTKSGFVYNWYDNSGFTGSALTTSTTLSGDKVFYAKWYKNLTYNPGNNGSSTSGICLDGQTFTLPATPVRENYTFAGWVVSK